MSDAWDNVPLPVAPRDTLNAAANWQSQFTFAAENSPLRIIYGQVRLGPLIANVLPYGGNFLILAVWGHGEIDSFVEDWVDDVKHAAFPTVTVQASGGKRRILNDAYSYVTHYTGTQTQTVDADLVAAFNQQVPAVAFTDAMVGVAYSVYVLKPSIASAFPRINAIIKGLKVFDNRAAPLATQTSLLYTSTSPGGANPFNYWRIAAPNYVIPAGARLEYDVYVDLANPASATGNIGGIEVDLAAAPSNGRSAGLVDGNGIICIVGPAAGAWTSRVLAFPASMIGGTITSVDLVDESDSAGTRRAWYRNIRITNAAGTTLLTIWASGAPTQNVLAYGIGTASVAEVAATAWTDNPAYCLADFITNSAYGCKRTVNWASVAAVAADCDAMVGTTTTEKRRLLNLSLDNVQSVSAWIDVLRTYAGCWVIPSGADLKLVSDKAGTSVATLDHAAGQIKGISALHKRGVQSTPTVMTLSYTNTTVTPYKQDSVTVYATGVLAGTTPRRESSVSLPGITRYSQAVREATERLNKLLLNDLSFSLQVFDEQLALDVGDIVTVSHPLGLVAKLMRVLGIKGEYGRFELALSEYDPAVYDATVATAPTYADTGLPNPMATLAAPTGLVVSEEVNQALDGTVASRFVISWTAPSDYYTLRYFVSIWDATHEVASGYTAGTTYAHGPLVDGVTYTVKVYAERVVTQVRSAVLSGTYGMVGDTTVPANIADAAITVTYSAAGMVLAWPAVTNRTVHHYEITKELNLIDQPNPVTVLATATPTYNLGMVPSKVTALEAYKIKAVAPNGIKSAVAGRLFAYPSQWVLFKI